MLKQSTAQTIGPVVPQNFDMGPCLLGCSSCAGAEAPTLGRHHPGDDGGRRECYTANSTAGGFQVPSPGGRIEGASVFGQ
jgi:hypothetical protein